MSLHSLGAKCFQILCTSITASLQRGIKASKDNAEGKLPWSPPQRDRSSEIWITNSFPCFSGLETTVNFILNCARCVIRMSFIHFELLMYWLFTKLNNYPWWKMVMIQSWPNSHLSFNLCSHYYIIRAELIRVLKYWLLSSFKTKIDNAPNQ